MEVDEIQTFRGFYVVVRNGERIRVLWDDSGCELNGAIWRMVEIVFALFRLESGEWSHF